MSEERAGYAAKALSDYQAEVGEWADRVFTDSRVAWKPLLGINEELGELAQALAAVADSERVYKHLAAASGRLCHAYLKREQGIRGTRAEHDAAIRDAVGDILIFLLNFCHREGLDAGTILAETWEQVRKRDWRAHPLTGIEAAP